MKKGDIKRIYLPIPLNILNVNKLTILYLSYFRVGYFPYLIKSTTNIDYYELLEYYLTKTSHGKSRLFRALDKILESETSNRNTLQMFQKFNPPLWSYVAARDKAQLSMSKYEAFYDQLKKWDKFGFLISPQKLNHISQGVNQYLMDQGIIVKETADKKCAYIENFTKIWEIAQFKGLYSDNSIIRATWDGKRRDDTEIVHMSIVFTDKNSQSSDSLIYHTIYKGNGYNQSIIFSD
jgi:hypothetical protein